MSDLGPLVRRYGFDALIVLAAIVIALEGAFRDGADPPTTTRWFTVPALSLIVLPLLLRRRFPFAAPAAVWVIAAGCALVDGRLVVFSVISSVAGMVAAFLLGNLRDDTQARLGLAIVVSGAAIVIYNNPGHAPGELVFVPVLFAIGWLAGYALRERAAQAEQAEERALEAELRRESAARLAVAEERARIARELHDVVAHAVSVMVLQVGAVRHNLPPELAADSDALKDVELAGRSALTEMRRLLGAMHDGEDADLAPQPGLDSLDSLVERVSRAGLPGTAPGRRRRRRAAARGRSLRIPNRPGGPDELAQAREREPGRRHRPLRLGCRAARGPRRRHRRRHERRARPRARRRP